MKTEEDNIGYDQLKMLAQDRSTAAVVLVNIIGE